MFWLWVSSHWLACSIWRISWSSLSFGSGISMFSTAERKWWEMIGRSWVGRSWLSQLGGLSCASWLTWVARGPFFSVTPVECFLSRPEFFSLVPGSPFSSASRSGWGSMHHCRKLWEGGSRDILRSCFVGSLSAFCEYPSPGGLFVASDSAFATMHQSPANRKESSSAS